MKQCHIIVQVLFATGKADMISNKVDIRYEFPNDLNLESTHTHTHKKNNLEILGLKLLRLSPASLLKKRLWHRCFPVNFAKFLRATFLENTSKLLLLHIKTSQLIRSPRHIEGSQFYLQNKPIYRFPYLYDGDLRIPGSIS